MPKATLGRIVLYLNGADYVPAIVVTVPAEDDAVMLELFAPRNKKWVWAVEGTEVGQYVWPERNGD